MNNRFLIYVSFLAIIFTGCGKFPEIGGEYKLRYDPRNYIGIVDTLNTVIIEGQVLDVAFDPQFILVHQKPVDSVCRCIYDCYKNNEDEYNSYDNCDEAFENSSIQVFWIIDKTEKLNRDTRPYQNIYGPFSKDEYLQQREILGVPQELIFTKIKLD